MPAPFTTNNLSRTAAAAGTCTQCAEFITAMNASFQAVHDYILANRDQRALNEDYLGDLGRLIQLQVSAYRKLVNHQRQHPTAKD